MMGFKVFWTRNCHSQLNGPGLDSLKQWAFKYLRAVILQLIETKNKVQESSATTVTNTQFLDFLVKIVGSLVWCLNRLQVQTTPYRPLPLTTNPNKQTKGGQSHCASEQLLCGMAVSLKSCLPSPMITDMSVALQ
jgi:hypothetical protein